MTRWMTMPTLLALVALATPRTAEAEFKVQCPDRGPQTRCFTLAASDGMVTGANRPDGVNRSDIYMFGFSDASGLPWPQRDEARPAANWGFDPGASVADPYMYMMDYEMAASFPAPTLVMREGDEVFLTLSNVGMKIRPDLPDPHTVHFHGFPNAAPVFDGVPESSFGINMNASVTYYYRPLDAGTYMWHCHQEAAEHLQMGMIGQLIVLPGQDGQAKTFQGRTYTKFAYNDGDGSTGYDVAWPIQMAGFDPWFHKLEFDVQAGDFAAMKDTIGMLNGRAYPDTLEPGPVLNVDGNPSQPLSTAVEVRTGQRLLLRFSSLSTTRFYTVTALGLPMQVIAVGARHLVGPGGAPAYYDTGSVTLGGGESTDVIVDLEDVSPGTYFLYTTNLNHLSTDSEDFGGMMTEIRVLP